MNPRIRNFRIIVGMTRLKLEIDRKKLDFLYTHKRFSQVKIGAAFGCSFSTIKNRLKEFGIPFRNPAEARLRYKKLPFSGSPVERAYMLGFAMGDLNVYRPSEKGVTIVARCHTTQEAQTRVFRDCFAKYGRVTISKSKKEFHGAAYLDAGSFSFLLEKTQVPVWVFGQARWSFIAGYNDAEGNFLLNQGRARMKIDSYDDFALRWIQERLSSENISCKLRVIARQGERHPQGYRFRKDLWRLNVNEAHSLRCLLKLLLPHTRHEQRKADMLVCLRNIEMRARAGTI